MPQQPESDDSEFLISTAVDSYLQRQRDKKEFRKSHWELPAIIGGQHTNETWEGRHTNDTGESKLTQGQSKKSIGSRSAPRHVSSMQFVQECKKDLLRMHGEVDFNYERDRHLPTLVRDFFQLIDSNGEGVITPSDLVAVAQLVRHFRDHNLNNSGEICYLYFGEVVQEALSVWDVDGNGSVNITELVKAAHAQKKLKTQMSLLRKILLALVLFVFVLCCAIFGLTFVAIELAKETHAEGSVIVSADDGKPIGMVAAKSSVPLLQLADPSVPASVLSSVKHLNLEAITGEIFGVSIQQFQRSTTGELTMYSAIGSKVVVSKGGAYIVAEGTKYTLKTHDSNGRRLSSDQSNNFGVAELSQSLSPAQSCGLGLCGDELERDTCSENMQACACDDLESEFDCGVVEQCRWDSRIAVCHFRCEYLTSKNLCDTKGAAPEGQSHGCHWFEQPSEITGQRCDLDCTLRHSLAECILSASCMWTGETCEIGCSQYDTRGDCATGAMIAQTPGHCVWEHTEDEVGFCKHDCQKRVDRYSCDAAGLGEICLWDDCARTCRDSTKVLMYDAAWRRKLQLGSDCSDRGVNSRWYWNYQCTGPYSHCYVEDYATPDAVFTEGNKCGFSNRSYQHCLPDCEALNKLASDPQYAKAEPVFDTGSNPSLEKAKYFCEQERASCTWKNDKCEWKNTCDEKWPLQVLNAKRVEIQQNLLWLSRSDMCDAHTCTAARSGGGSSPIDLHGMCQSVNSVTGIGHLRQSRCFLKCELRYTQEHCMSQGEGGRLSDEYKGSPCGPLKLDEQGELDEINGRLRIPQECISMCRWTDDRCLTACEFREKESDCTGTCSWNSDKSSGVLEFGSLPDLISCTGDPSEPLDVANIKQMAASAVGNFTEKGGAGFGGPVSTCILKASLELGNPMPGAGTARRASGHMCYDTTPLKLDTRYEKTYVPIDPSAPTQSLGTCVQDPPETIMSPKIKITMRNRVGPMNTNMFETCPYRSYFKTALVEGFTQALNFDLSSTGYALSTEWVFVQEMNIGIDTSGTFVISVYFRMRLPTGHRPSSVKDMLFGNPARGQVGLFQLGTATANEFPNAFKDFAFSMNWETTLFDGARSDWDVAASFETAEYITAVTPAPLPPQSVLIPSGASLTWIVTAGPCKVDASGCAMSPGYAGNYADSKSCKILVQLGGAVHVESFNTERCGDYLSVGEGQKYSGDAAGLHGSLLASGVELTWSSDRSISNSGWKLCPGTTTTTTPTPVSTSTPLSSCPGISSGPQPSWNMISGSCQVDETKLCAMSPNYPAEYSTGEKCMFAADMDAKISVTAFVTEADYDVLTVQSITGQPPPPCTGSAPSSAGYSGTGGPEGVYVGVDSIVQWTSDESTSDVGWKLCLESTR